MLQDNYGPTVPMSIELHASKYRNEGETFYDRCCRIAAALADGDDHRRAVKDILLDMAFLPAGRVQRSVGAPQQTTPYNCFVSGDLPDESAGIFERLGEAFQTLRLGGGIGTDFSTLRPSGDPLRSINSIARGPLPFMDVFDYAGRAVKGSGDRDAAQMGVLRIDHPDIEKFIAAKQNETRLKGMNISVAVTDEFVEAFASGKSFSTRFNGTAYQQLDARSLWNSIMRSTWDWAEPGVLFIDRINRMNNLYYCETIRATNPCLTGDTRLLTSNGYRTMEELWEAGGRQEYSGSPSIDKHGQLNIVNDRGEVPATNVYRTARSAPVYRVTMSDGSYVDATATHQFVKIVDDQETMVSTSDLKEGDLIPLGQQSAFGTFHDPDYAMLAGWVIGDGSLVEDKGQVRAVVTCYQADIEDVMPQLSEALQRVYKFHTISSDQSPKFKPWEREQEHFKHREVSIRSSVLGRMMKTDGVVPGDKHRVPQSVWNGDRETVAAFLRALFSADGSVQISNYQKSISIRLAQKSSSLLRSCQLLISQFGITSSVLLRRAARQQMMNDGKGGIKLYNTADQYELIISGRTNADNFQREIGFIQPRQNVKAKNWLDVHPGSNNSTPRRSTKVNSIVYIGEKTTYCLTEPERNRIVVNGLTTGQCGEQPLPAYGACLLGSFNLTRYLKRRGGTYIFDFERFSSHVHTIVRAMDNIVDRAVYPLPQQRQEALNKRRMGLGITGMANTLEIMGLSYGSTNYLVRQSQILATLRDEAYLASVDLAREKGAFPLFDRAKYVNGEFIRTLPDELIELIAEHGIRNSHLTSIAPTGTISLSADNISSGIEPVFRHEFDRTYRLEGVDVKETVTDYAFREFAVRGRMAEELAPSEHVAVLCAAQQYVDSACSKTCNIGDGVSWEDFQAVYLQAWEGGAKGCTTYRAAGKRAGIFSRSETKPATPVVISIPTDFKPEDAPDQAMACTYDPVTGIRSCE